MAEFFLNRCSTAASLYLPQLRKITISISYDFMYKNLNTRIKILKIMSEYLSQDIDLLDFLRTKLGDLSGFATLANELIQNAEDAKASQITFNVTDQELIVQNDSEFSEDDFQRMQKIAGGGKDKEEEFTIGRFGIGFISVYQITDHPQVISSGRHLTFYPEQDTQKRIIRKEVKYSPGTKFILPWAKENSSIRQKLRLDKITSQSINYLVNELNDYLETTILFLQNIHNIHLNTKDICGTVRRRWSVHNQHFVTEIIDNHGNVRQNTGWYVLSSNFAEQAIKIKSETQYISSKAKSDVLIAIPDTNINLEGLIYAFLPTKQQLGLPFHINADFFVSSDRKNVSFENNYRGKWNCAALEKSISCFINNLDNLKYKLGHHYLWKIIEKFKNNTSWWKLIQHQVVSTPLIWTTNQNWCKPKESFLLKEYQQEKNVLPLLEQMGVSIVHPELNEYSSLLNSNDIGVLFIDISVLTNFILSSGLNRTVSIQEAPQWIRNEHNRNLLSFEIEILLRRYRFSSLLGQKKNLVAQCAIALGNDGKFHPINSLYIAQVSTVQLFKDLNAPLVFLSHDNPSGITQIINDYKLAKVFTAEAVITALENMDISKLQQQLQKPNMLRRLFQFFSEHQKKFIEGNLKQRLCNLKIFPSGGKLLPLTNLLVPGSFNDPLHLASLVDMELIGQHRELLINLGAQELTLIKYVRDLVPSALKEE